MSLRKALPVTLFCLLIFAGILQATPSYRSFVEWNGPYYHVRHALTADSSGYLDYLVNNPLPLFGSPFSSPTALEIYGLATSPDVFVVDHDQRRVQVFTGTMGWKVESLSYSATPVQGNFGGRFVKFSLGGIAPGSERVTINGKYFTRVGSLIGYTASDSVYTVLYDGVPNTGGVCTLPSGWDLASTDSVRVEYAFANPPGTPGSNDLDYVLFQGTPTDVPLQLNEATSTTDPAMTDLTSIAVHASVRAGKALDLYLVNGLPGGAGSLASYDLTTIGAGGVFSHVDTYPGMLGRPYDVEIVDNGTNTAQTVAEGVPSGTANTKIAEAITNQNTFLAHDYRIAFAFDTCTTMNQVAAAANMESDFFYQQSTGRIHMVFCKDDASQGTAYSYSDDNGQTWAAAVTISPATLTAAHDRPRIAVLHSGEIHVVYEAVNGDGDRHLYHTYSSDGVSWSATTEITTSLTPATVAENRYANLLVSDTDLLYLIWAGDDDVYYSVYSGSWGGITQIATGTGVGFSAPSAAIDGVGRIYMAYVSDAAAPSKISYMMFNGALWGSYDLGGFTAGTPDPVTIASGVAVAGAGRGQAYPFPQVVLTGDSVWVLWAGQGTETYPTDPIQLYSNHINSLDGNFTPGSTAITTADEVAPMRFSAVADANHNIHVVYPFGNGINLDREGLRYAKYSGGAWSCAGTTGRTIFVTGGAATIYSYEPRVLAPTINEQVTPLLACTKAYTTLGAGSPRALFKVIDGVMKVTDQTTLSEINQWAPWTTGVADTRTIPGLSFTITNTAITISNTDNVDATEFNVGDYFELTGTPAAKNDLLFLTDSDNHRFKVIRAYDNIDNCFGGAVRWDVPGQSDGTPSQTYKLATTGGEGTYHVWASQDSTAWTIVDNLLIAGATDRVCTVDRYTHEIRFGDGAHGLIPPVGAYIRVRYEESVDEAEFGSLGAGAAQMNYPHGLAVYYNTGLGQYDVYVCDTGNNRLKKFKYAPDVNINPHNWTSPICNWSAASSPSDNLSSPEDVEVVTYQSKVYLVVSDRGKGRVVIYRDDEATGSGGSTPPTFVAQIGSTGNTLGQFMDPRGLAVTAEDSGLVVFAADADRDEVAKILNRDWLTTSSSDTGTGGGAMDNTLRLSFVDPIDGDNTLLLQPDATRTIEVRLAKTDSLVAVKAQASFPASMMEIVSINEGNLWSGERYTNKIFLENFNNTAGTLEINTSEVGDDDGLSSNGSRVIATIVIHAKAGVTVPASGSITLGDSTELRKVGNLLVNSSTRTNLNLKLGYLADIASDGGNPGTPPAMVPSPDGKIDFADVNVFTQGWNGNGVTFDPISDLGPYLGTQVPNLQANPDGKLDAYDLLSLNTMYNWYHGISTFEAPPSPPVVTRSNLDVAAPLVLVKRQTEHGWTVEVQARDVTYLSTAHLYVEVKNVGGSILNVREGGFLGQNANTLFLHSEQGNAADICMGRLSPQSPNVSGSGVLASLDLSIPNNTEPEVRVIFELRNSQNDVMATAELQQVEPEAVPTVFSLDAPYPNPFNMTTNFAINLPEAAKVKLRIFNVLGQEVASLVNRDLPAGTHHINWEAKDNSGAPLTTGIYFARLESGSRTDIRKLILLK